MATIKRVADTLARKVGESKCRSNEAEGEDGLEKLHIVARVTRVG